MRPVTSRLYNLSAFGEKWKGIGKHRRTSVLVKGTNRRVIVVRSPDPALFEEAIFVLKEGGDAPQDADLVMEQARRAAGEYLRQCGMKAHTKGRRSVWVTLAAVGVILAGLSAAWYFLL